jgi:hypothetical protein
MAGCAGKQPTHRMLAGTHLRAHAATASRIRRRPNWASRCLLSPPLSSLPLLLSPPPEEEVDQPLQLPPRPLSFLSPPPLPPLSFLSSPPLLPLSLLLPLLLLFPPSLLLLPPLPCFPLSPLHEGLGEGEGEGEGKGEDDGGGGDDGEGWAPLLAPLPPLLSDPPFLDLSEVGPELGPPPPPPMKQLAQFEQRWPDGAPDGHGTRRQRAAMTPTERSAILEKAEDDMSLGVGRRFGAGGGGQSEVGFGSFAKRWSDWVIAWRLLQQSSLRPPCIHQCSHQRSASSHAVKRVRLHGRRAAGHITGWQRPDPPPLALTCGAGHRSTSAGWMHNWRRIGRGLRWEERAGFELVAGSSEAQTGAASSR